MGRQRTAVGPYLLHDLKQRSYRGIIFPSRVIKELQEGSRASPVQDQNRA
jgi:hypothetical protein